jgi:hypothetical protein
MTPQKTPAEVEQERRDENRRTRAENHAIKKQRRWACAECGTTERVLAVTVKSTGEETTRCEDKCLDRRVVTVRPLQFDERERNAT